MKKLCAKTLYDMAFPIVDYSGDVNKGSGQYHEMYSPNNLKKLFIAPDMVAGLYHIAVGGKRTKVVRIPMELYMACSQMIGYVPIVQILAGDRVCSSIEEIVFMCAADGTPLSMADGDVQSLIKGFSGRGGADGVDSMKRRFVRLRVISVSSMRSSELDIIRVADRNLLCEMGLTTNDIWIHSESDWYRHYGSPAAAKTYPAMDGADGILTRHFKTLISRYEAEELDEKIHGRQRQIAAEKEKLYKSTLEKYKSMYLDSKKLVDMAENCHRKYMGKVDSFRYMKLCSLWDVGGVPSGMADPVPEGMQLKDAYDENIRSMRKAMVEHLLYLFGMCRNVLSAMCKDWEQLVPDWLDDGNMPKSDSGLDDLHSKVTNLLYRLLGERVA